MSKFKYFFKCCCQYACDFEEEKNTNALKIEDIQNRSLGENMNLSNFLHVEESSILAAPSPIMDCSIIDSPKLRIKILESSAVTAGTILNINSAGMEESKRSKSDSKTYIGALYEENGEILNDFIIDENSKGMGKQHFVIKFHSGRQKYLISDLGDGSGTFVKINAPLLLKDGLIISFGNSHMTIHLNSINK